MGWSITTYEDVHGPGQRVPCGCCGRGSKVARFSLYSVPPRLRDALHAARDAHPEIEGVLDVDFDSPWICDATWHKLLGRIKQLDMKCLFTRDTLCEAMGAPPERVEQIRRTVSNNRFMADRTPILPVLESLFR